MDIIIYGGIFLIIVLLIIMITLIAGVKRNAEDQSGNMQQFEAARNDYMRQFGEIEKYFVL